MGRMDRDEPGEVHSKLLIFACVELREDPLIPLHLDGLYTIHRRGVEAQSPTNAMGKGLRELLAELQLGVSIRAAFHIKPRVYAITLLGLPVGTDDSVQVWQSGTSEPIVQIQVRKVGGLVPIRGGQHRLDLAWIGSGTGEVGCNAVFAQTDRRMSKILFLRKSDQGMH